MVFSKRLLTVFNGRLELIGPPGFLVITPHMGIISTFRETHVFSAIDTVDGRNPALVDMYNIP